MWFSGRTLGYHLQDPGFDLQYQTKDQKHENKTQLCSTHKHMRYTSKAHMSRDMNNFWPKSKNIKLFFLINVGNFRFNKESRLT